MPHVYFPVDAIVSLLFEMSDGVSAEISVVGNEGIVGVAVFLGGGSTPSRAIVRSEGKAYCNPVNYLFEVRYPTRRSQMAGECVN